MELNQYLRLKVNQYIRPLFIKEKCEICSNNDVLHLHHVKLFSEIVDETLNELKLFYKNLEEYTEIELQNITNIVLGKHLQIEYLTLCEKCHWLIHEEEWKEVTVNEKHKKHYEILKLNKVKVRRIYNQRILIPYLLKNEGKRLLRNEINELIKIFSIKENGKVKRSLSSLNKYLSDNDINFYIESKSTSTMQMGEQIYYRYWIVKSNK